MVTERRGPPNSRLMYRVMAAAGPAAELPELLRLAVAPLGAKHQVEGRQAQHALHSAHGSAAESKH